MPEVALKTLLAGLPPEPLSVLGEIQALIRASQRKVIVLDDDPTGTQTVYGISVLTEWSIPILQAELDSNSPGFFLLTNSRSLSPASAFSLYRQIGSNLKSAAQAAGVELTIISRSDSTLRGHFPAEMQALEEGLATSFDGWLLAPYFREGGRLTIADMHYVVSDEKAFPAGETEYARDPAFGYTQSNLRKWVAEKTVGKIPADRVTSLSIPDLRSGNVLPGLLGLKNGQVCIINAASDSDMEVATRALLQAEAQGKQFLYRTAASFVRTRFGLPPRQLLRPSELRAKTGIGRLVIVGSFVPRTTAQLEHLRSSQLFVEIELDVAALIKEDSRPGLLSQAIETMNRSLAAGQNVLIFTSRQLISGVDGCASLKLGETISQSLVECVRGLTVRPRYFIAKGGITSSDIATRGLQVRKALVRGQILPGVPVWQLGSESRFPGLNYVVFPGNVGAASALTDVVTTFSDKDSIC